MYIYCFFPFEYFDQYDHYAACWVTLICIQVPYQPKMQNLFKSCVGLFTDLHALKILQYMTSRIVSNLLKLEYFS